MRKLSLIILAIGLTGLGFAEVLPINKFGGLDTDQSPLALDGQSPDSENVVTDIDGRIQGRHGFLKVSTTPSTGLWSFPMSNGTKYMITMDNGNLKASANSTNFTVFIDTVPTDRTVAGTVLGDYFYYSDTLNGLKRWNGTTVSVASDAMKVDILTTFKGRLAAAGKSGSTRIIFLSAYLDGTKWNLQTNPVETDPTQITISGPLDENIISLFPFQDKLMAYKAHHFGGLFGSRRSNFIYRSFSDNVGLSSPGTIQDCDGKLRWFGMERTMWEFDGTTYKKISEPIDTLMGTVLQGDTNSRNYTQTTSEQWNDGTISPTGFATTVNGDVKPLVTANFNYLTSLDGATQSPSNYFTANGDGYAYLTFENSNSFIDTSQSDFEAGTFTGTTATQTVGAVELLRTNSGEKQSVYNDDLGPAYVTYKEYQSFTAISSYILTDIILRIEYTGWGAGYTNVGIYSDNAGCLGTLLSTKKTYPPLTSRDPIDSTVTLTTPVYLTAGTRYWIGFGDGMAFSLRLQNTVTNGEYYSITGSGCSSGTRMKYKLRGYTYPASGNFISQTFDVGTTTNSWLWNWDQFQPGTNVPANTNITYQTQTSADGSNWDALQSVTTIPTSTVRRYIRYKATLTTSDTRYTPSLYDVTVGLTSKIRPWGTITSPTVDTTFNTPVWGPISYSTVSVGTGGEAVLYTQTSYNGSTWDDRVAVTPNQPPGSAQKRYLRWVWVSTATSQANYNMLDSVGIPYTATGTFTTNSFYIGTNISTWGPIVINDATGGLGAITYQFSSSDTANFNVWNTISKTGTPVASTQPYAAVKAIFSVGSTTDTATLQDITLNWTEGSTIKSPSGYYGQRYYVAVATTGTQNRMMLVYDKRGEWQRYTGLQADVMVMHNARLYFGNSSGIYLTESGYNDNGSAIYSYYRTPTLVPTALDLYSKFNYLYMTTDNSDSTLATSYQFNGDESTNYSLGSYQMNQKDGIQNFKLPFSASSGVQGKYISFKWSVSGTSAWRILNGDLFYDKDLIPE